MISNLSLFFNVFLEKERRMKKITIGTLFLMFGFVACTDDDVPTDFFQIADRTTYNVTLVGDFTDSLYFKNDTLQQWENSGGKEELTGIMYVNDVTDERNFVGYIQWDNRVRTYQKQVIRQLFTQWDTTSSSGANESLALGDSIVPVVGRLRDYGLGFRNDSVPLLLSSKNLQFEIDDQTASAIDASAGYQVRSTLIDGHPDSTDIYYLRRYWDLSNFSVRTP